MASYFRSKRQLNLPNLFTLIRIIITPLLIILLINGRFMDALIAFTCAGITDALDGLIARILGQKTRIGAILDPIADKLLLTSSYVTLAVIGQLPKWLAIVVISRDVIIVLGVLILFLVQTEFEIRPTILGKLTTLFQLGAIFMILLTKELGVINQFIYPLILVTATLTISSGAHYMFLGVGILGKLDNGQKHQPLKR